MRYISVILVFFFAAKISAQGNLVPNSSFEQKTSCPNSSGQLSLSTGWINPTFASPDFYHACCPVNYGLSVPDNLEGSQFAHTDSAYAGVICFLGSREYIQTQLSYSLKQGHTYCVSYYVSLAGRSDYSTAGPQLLFSVNAISGSSMNNLPYTPQIMDSTIISDTINWKLIYGEYSANGNEQFITIGNFFNNVNTPYDTIGNYSNPVAYFYIDDVSVYEKMNANAGAGLSICSADSVKIGMLAIDSGVVYSWSPPIGLSDPSSSHPWAKPDSTTTYVLTISDPGGLYCLANSIDSVTITVNDCPNLPEYFVPTILKKNELFTISALQENTGLEIFDTRGRLIYRNENYQNDFRASNLAVGIYAYCLNFSDGSSQKGKVCVVE